MTKELESKISEILRKHIQRACDEIASKELLDSLFWPDGFAQRLADQVATTIAFCQESTEQGASS